MHSRVHSPDESHSSANPYSERPQTPSRCFQADPLLHRSVALFLLMDAGSVLQATSWISINSFSLSLSKQPIEIPQGPRSLLDTWQATDVACQVFRFKCACASGKPTKSLYLICSDQSASQRDPPGRFQAVDISSAALLHKDGFLGRWFAMWPNRHNKRPPRRDGPDKAALRGRPSGSRPSEINPNIEAQSIGVDIERPIRMLRRLGGQLAGAHERQRQHIHLTLT